MSKKNRKGDISQSLVLLYVALGWLEKNTFEHTVFDYTESFHKIIDVLKCTGWIHLNLAIYIVTSF